MKMKYILNRTILMKK